MYITLGLKCVNKILELLELNVSWFSKSSSVWELDSAAQDAIARGLDNESVPVQTMQEMIDQNIMPPVVGVGEETLSLLFAYDTQSTSEHYYVIKSNGNIFRVTGTLCGEFTGHRWIPHTKASDAELWFFYLRLNERLSKPSWGWWFETPSRPFWRHCNEKRCRRPPLCSGYFGIVSVSLNTRVKFTSLS